MKPKSNRASRAPAEPAVQAEDVSAARQRARNETAGRVAEDRFHVLFESSRDAIMTVEPPSWRFTSGNPATVSMFRAASERDFTSREPWSLSPRRQPDGRLSSEKAREMIEIALREGSHAFEWRHARIGGEEFPATVLLTRVESGGKTFLQATVRDITAQKQAELALQSSEEKYRALIETTTTGFLILDAVGKVVDANQEYVRLSGHDTLEQILGRRVVEWTAPYDLARNAREVKKCAAQGFVRNLAIDYVGHGGQIIPVEINATVVGRGSSARIYSLCRDITDRKRIEDELRKRTRQLAQVASELTMSEQRERRRLAELLHEHLQQLLVGARMEVHSLAAEAGGRNRQALDGLSRTLDEALSSSRAITRDLAPPVSMHKDLPAAMRWLECEMRARHHLAVSVRVGMKVIPVTEAASVLLFTAARELLLNVAKHAGCGKASLRLRQEPGAIVLIVSDQGKGADPEALQAPSSRHGFGLFSIRERAELLGGSLTVDSGSGRGMRVALSLPVTTEMPVAAEAAVDAARVPRRSPDRPRGGRSAGSGHSIRVVFADDHRTLREALVSLLRSEPGLVIVGEAENGREAIECVQRLRPDVVVMDVSMPVMDGVEATRAITSRWPDVRIIGLSMHDDAGVARRMRDAGARDYVTKSAPPERLIRAIRNCAAKGATA